MRRWRRAPPAGSGLTRAEIGTLLAFAKIALFNDLVEQRRARRSLSRARALPLFPIADARALRRRDRGPSAAPRDHRDAACELGHQSRRPDAARRRARPHRRFRGRADPRLCGRARQLRPAGAARRDRRARHEDIRPAAARALRRSCRTCWSTGSAGSPAISIRPPGWPTSSRTIAPRSRNWPPSCPRSCRASARRRCGTASHKLKAGRVPEELAARLALLPTLARAANVVPIADRAGQSMADAAKAYFAVSDRFGFGRIDQMTEEVATGDYYEGLALQKARDSLEAAHRDLAQHVIANGTAPTSRPGRRAPASASPRPPSRWKRSSPTGGRRWPRSRSQRAFCRSWRAAELMLAKSAARCRTRPTVRRATTRLADSPSRSAGSGR